LLRNHSDGRRRRAVFWHVCDLPIRGAYMPTTRVGTYAPPAGKVSESSVGKTALSGCRGPNHRENGCLPRSLRGSAPKIPQALAFGGGLVYVTGAAESL
jgi:hypothetical protein